jgi:glutamine synthetase
MDEYFEHRLPSSSCFILQSFNAILEGVIKGINSKDDCQITLLHSNAFEDEVIKTFNLSIIWLNLDV